MEQGNRKSDAHSGSRFHLSFLFPPSKECAVPSSGGTAYISLNILDVIHELNIRVVQGLTGIQTISGRSRYRFRLRMHESAIAMPVAGGGETCWEEGLERGK
ncbi:MAG TPA: hypothetical protein VGB07_20270 [Blastocatellia bacterium]